MKFDIASLNTAYRGIDRALNSSDLYSKGTKEHFDELLDYYFKYLDLMYSSKGVSYNLTTFDCLLKYYDKFRGYGVNCEMIAYDNFPIDHIFNKQIKLLGIDVVADLSESLLECPDSISEIEQKCLNSFGLLRNLKDLNIVLKNSFCGDNDWKPCWVYKIII